jgi:N,N'-diacetyllegionaminate synthase
MIHIIAEAGTNHNGSITEAKRLIDLASIAGADSVKFQHINTWDLYLPGNYEYGSYDIHNVIATRKKTEFSFKNLVELNEYAHSKSILFSASVFGERGLNDLVQLDSPYIKIASCDLNNIRFIRQVSKTNSKIVLSTGQSSLKEIEFTINEMSKIRNMENVILLHCVSIYPCRTKETNIGFISTLRRHFELEVGFSDHTQSNSASLVALGLGATWFEKHFTIDRSQEGLDHAYALEKNDLLGYISSLKDAQLALEHKDEKVSDKEKLVAKRARRGLYAARDISPAELIKDEDILCVRPQGPIDAHEIDNVIGKKLKKEMKKYEPFTRDNIY